MNTGYLNLSYIGQYDVADLRPDTQTLLQRAQQLSEPDRTVVTMYLQNAASFRQIAKLTDLSESAVARRIRKILAVLSDEKLNALLTSGKLLSRRQKKVIRDHFFGGLTLGDIARKHKMSYYNARRIVRVVRKIIQQTEYNITVRNY